MVVGSNPTGGMRKWNSVPLPSEVRFANFQASGMRIGEAPPRIRRTNGLRPFVLAAGSPSRLHQCAGCAAAGRERTVDRGVTDRVGRFAGEPEAAVDAGGQLLAIVG